MSSFPTIKTVIDVPSKGAVKNFIGTLERIIKMVLNFHRKGLIVPRC